ncbi:MAG: 3D domain-containing protein [Bacilli bacterium]
MITCRTKLIKKFIYLVAVVVIFFVILAMGNKKVVFMTYNVNSVKSIEAIHIVSKYQFNLHEPIPNLYDDFNDLVANGTKQAVSFIGSLTGYGPDCVGCGGKVGCPPRPNVTNGNIFFEDKEYGKINIVATDPSIPCGSIVKISNYKHMNGDFTAIALDRGGAIKGKTMDLLYESEAATKSVGRQNNVKFNIIRWGW